MKILSIFTALLLVCTLASCSSGSSDEPEQQTSTNTIPPANNSANEGSTTDTSQENQNGEGESTAGTGGDGSNTDGSSGATDGANEGAQTAGQNEPDAGNGQDETDAGTGDISMPDTGDTGGTTNTPDTTINPDTALGQLQTRIKTLTGRTLLALNESLNQGEILSDQQDQCLGTYDPAFGEPVLAIDCERALATGTVAIFASIVAFKNTNQCVASLQNANVDQCDVERAQLQVNTLWITPETAPGQPARPQPLAGAMIRYNITPNKLSVENVEPAVSGLFSCEYDLTTGDAQNTGQGGDCDEQLNRITDLIDEHLS